MANPEVIEPKFTKVAVDLKGAEGPVFDRDGKFYMVAPERTPAGDVVAVDLTTGKVDLVFTPYDGEYGGIPAGCQCDLENNIWIADMRLGILKMEPSGNYKQMFKKDNTGRCMQGCNDCTFDYEGNLWVTAPAGDIAPAEFRRSSEEPFGSVYCVTKDGTLVRIDGDLQFPNGIAVQHTAEGRPSKLIVAETPTKKLWAYDILGPGKVGPRSVWGVCPGTNINGPDGMDFDEQGNLIVAHHSSSFLDVFSPAGGDPVLRVKCPFLSPSNVHFQPGGNTIYVTEHEFHSLWKFEWKNKGAKQYCETK